MSEKSKHYGKVSMEEALNITGFGIYSYWQVILTGVTIISFALLAYSSTVIVATSACELATTSAQQGLIASAPIIGLTIGPIPWGYVADRYGRRNTLVLALVLASLLNFVRAISVNWIMLVAMELIVNLAASGIAILALALLSECVPMAKRNLAVLLVTSIFLPAQGIIAVIGLPIIPLTFSYYIPSLGIYWNSWRTLQAVYSIPGLLCAICHLLMTESPKFALTKGDEERTMNILRNLHRGNNGKSESFEVTGIIKEIEKKTEKLSPREQIMPIFRKPLLKYTIIMTALLICEQVGSLQIWFPTIANRFMQMIETGAPMDQTLCDVLRSNVDAPVDPDRIPCSLNQTAMLIVLASGSAQSIYNLLISTVVNKAGRRNIVIVMAAVCGLCGILVNLVPNTVASIVLFVLYLLGYSVQGLYFAIAAALFPTNVRALAIAFAICIGRIATIGSIQLLNYLLIYSCDAGFYIFSTLFALSAVAASFLPDDRLLVQQDQDLKKTDGESTQM